jgi:large subunit ribosomal protein L5
MARLKETYNNEVVPRLKEQFGFDNIMEVPRIEKIVVNMGVGEAVSDAKRLDTAVRDLTLITGQKPIITKARISVAGFKLRQGNAIGCKVTLRGNRMFEFLDRLINLALPRIRDFRGLNPNSFDKAGNYSLGLVEQGVFPEIDLDSIDYNQGMDITIVISNKSVEHSREMLRLLGMPFRETEVVQR